MSRLSRLCNQGFWHTTSDMPDRPPLERRRRHRSAALEQEWRHAQDGSGGGGSSGTPPSSNSHSSSSTSYRRASIGHLHLIDDDDRYTALGTMGRPSRGYQSVRFADGANTIHRFSTDRATDSLNPGCSRPDFYPLPNKKMQANGHHASYSSLHRPPMPNFFQQPKQRRSIADVYSIPMGGYHRLEDDEEPGWWKGTWKGGQYGANLRLQAESSPSNSNHSHGSGFYSSSPFRSSKYHDDQPSPRRQPVRLRRFYDPIPIRESDYTFTKKGSSRRSTLANNNGSQGLVKRFITQVRDRLSAAVDGKKPHRMVVTHIEKPRSDSYYRHAHKNGWMKYSK